MTKTNTHFKIFLIAVSLFTLAHSTSFAGGFPVRPKRLLLSPSVSYFYANSGWDSLRRKNPFPNGGHFQSIGFSLYAEYGISRRLAAVALLPYVHNTYEDSQYKTTSSGLTDLEIGLRYYVANINYIYYFTVQGTFITPLYNDLGLGYREQGAEIKLAFAGSGKVFGKNYYFTLENGVRQYFGPDGPTQDRYTGTFGLTLDRRFHHQLSVSLGGFYSSSKFTQFSPIQAVNKNFAFNQASLTYGYTANKRLSFFVTGGHFINGRNTGDGTTASFSVLIKPFR
ncbi:MAG: hypothetical protein JKY70_13615 [Mucilaginibacter sp.]|nr:hypothetical protein [Mucilaginibacter sp.]